MFKKLKLSDCQQGLWSNGKGKTRQLAIYPHEATLAENNFDWRLSSATVSGENAFSIFPGMDRWLVVWKGEGLVLGGTKLLPHASYHFRGDEKINCSLIDGEVIDLGLIYDRKKVQAQLRVIHGINDIACESQTAILFLAMGHGLIGKNQLSEGEFLIIENSSYRIELAEGALAYLFIVSEY